MLKVILLAVLLALVAGAFAISGYGRVEKPAVGGTGPLAIEIEEGERAPDYHEQPSRIGWRAGHGARVTSSTALQECLTCHSPQTSCNRCHAYVGVKPILVAAAEPTTALPTETLEPTATPSAVPTTMVSFTTASPTAAPPTVIPTAAVSPTAASPTTVAARAPGFAKDIIPILRTRCAACHGALVGWDASTYDRVMNSGNNAPVIIPGTPDSSLLIQKLRNKQTIGAEMPPGNLLSAEEIDLFIRWVAAGSPNN